MEFLNYYVQVLPFFPILQGIQAVLDVDLLI
jgi:hypothetical protein